MKRLFTHGFKKRASSLIVSLLVIVVLSTIVVAFMQSMSIERLSAKSLKNIMQAELAAQAGYEAAVKQIEFAIGTNQAFVTGLTNYAAGYGPVTMIGRTNLTNSIQLMPLVSGTNSLSAFATAGWTAQLASYLAALTGTNTTDVNTRNRLIQNTNNTNLYRATWVSLTNSSGETNARYAYIVLDEHARLNPSIHTGTGFRTNATNWYGGPKDIILTNASAAILTAGEATNAAGLTNLLWTPETFGQAFAGRTNYENVKHLLTSSANPTFDVIPAENTNGGRPKYNINIAATNPTFYEPTSTNAAETIGRLIFTNLPLFVERDPSLRSQASAIKRRYLFRLGANIVDYIDTNSAPTLVNGGEPAGRDLHPLVTAVAQRFRRTALNTNSDPANITLESQCFVQVWNPYTSPVAVTNVSVRFVLKNQMRLYFGTGIATEFNDYDNTITTNLAVQPNEMTVLQFATTNQVWNSPLPVTNNAYITNSSTATADDTTWPTFELYIDGRLVDMQRRPPIVGPGTTTSGLSLSAAKRFTTATDTYSCFFIPSQSPGLAPIWRYPGDPRASFMSTYDWTSITSDSSYGTDSRWKGRQMNVQPRHQEYAATWLNRDYVRVSPTMGTAPGSIATTPAAVTSPYTAADAAGAVAVIRNQSMQSIGELGNVFDPIQASDDLIAPTGGSPSGSYVAAGARTLRIGQPEFTVNNANSWNTNGRRAIELLDLFTVNSTRVSGYKSHSVSWLLDKSS